MNYHYNMENNTIPTSKNKNSHHRECQGSISLQVPSTFLVKESNTSIPINTNQTFSRSTNPMILQLPKVVIPEELNNSMHNRYFYNNIKTYNKYKNHINIANDEHWINVKDWRKITTQKDKDVIAYDTSTNMFLFGVVSTKHSRSLFNPKVMNYYSISIDELFHAKNNVSRGKKRKGISYKYVLYGYRYPRSAKAGDH